MGKYLNPENLGFQNAINSQIYVEKTGLIEKMNRVLGTEQRWVCVSRARRFGKTMADPSFLKEYVGFTEEEVTALCGENDIEFEELRRWYDGYYFEEVGHVYNPRSVIKAILTGKFVNYWTATETYESLRFYIEMNLSG
ncbi:MAG: AAA family ATPase [Roseburia sp.]|nr:AAA family ATPase [Roseburia sp.]